MKIKHRSAIILALPFFLVLVMLLQFLKPKPKTWTEQGRMPSSTNVLDLWSKAEFVPVDSQATIRAAVGGMTHVQEGGVVPSEAQKRAAEELAVDFLMAFALKDLAAYKRFRLPASGQSFDENMLSFRRASLQKQGLLRAGDAGNDAESVIAGWYRRMFIQVGTNGIPLEQELPRIITGVAPKESSFLFQKRDSPPPPLNLFVTATDNNGYFEQRPFVSFSPTPGDLHSSKRNVEYLTMRLHVTSHSDPPMPIYFRFYWNERQERWIPFEHAIPYALRREHNYAF